MNQRTQIKWTQLLKILHYQNSLFTLKTLRNVEKVNCLLKPIKTQLNWENSCYCRECKKVFPDFLSITQLEVSVCVHVGVHVHACWNENGYYLRKKGASVRRGERRDERGSWGVAMRMCRSTLCERVITDIVWTCYNRSHDSANRINTMTTVKKEKHLE